MANQFSIDVDQSNDGIKVVSVPKTWLEGGNTPNWITPVVNYGMTSGGILIPQRVDSEGRPEITQYGSIVAEGKLFDAYAPTTSDVFDSSTPGTGGDDYIDLTKLRNISFLVECTLDVDVKFILAIGGRLGYHRTVFLYPDESGNFTAIKRMETMLAGRTYERYYFVNNAKQISDFNSFSGVPGLSRLYVQIEPQGVPTEGSITVYYRGDVIEVQN